MRFPLRRGTKVFQGSCVLKKARSDPKGRTRFLKVAQLVPSASSRRKGVLRLPPEGRASFGVLRRPSASFGVLRRPSASFGVLRRPSASFGVLRKASPLAGWRLSEGSARGEASRRKQLFYERPSGSFTSGGILPKEANLFLKEARLPPEGRASFASFGKLHLWRFLRKASPMGASRRTCNLRKDARSPN